MDQKLLENELAGLPLGPIRYFPTIGSTNSEAARWADAEAPDLSLVVADEQSAGRGRFHRRWFTPPGSALAFSLILRPKTTDEGRRTEEALLGFARLTALGALAVHEALQAGFGLQTQIKWPNDILAGGRKLAGILVESHWQGDRLSAAILGIGINVAPASVPPAEALNFPATSVEEGLGNVRVSRTGLLRAILARLLDWRPHLATDQFLKAWEMALAFRGEWVFIDQNIQEIDGDCAPAPRLEGQLLGLAPDGALRLRTRSGDEVLIQAGEIHLRPGGEP
jgi:BirA family biotin operon repressor/biotin-[acetyl-CoA-carboxylase] ligase